MKQVIFRREARADVLDAYRWYEKQESGLGAEFREELRATIERVRARPLAFRVLPRGGLLWVATDEGPPLQLLASLHAAPQHPDKLRGRCESAASAC